METPVTKGEGFQDVIAPDQCQCFIVIPGPISATLDDSLNSAQQSTYMKRERAAAGLIFLYILSCIILSVGRIPSFKGTFGWFVWRKQGTHREITVPTGTKTVLQSEAIETISCSTKNLSDHLIKLFLKEPTKVPGRTIKKWLFEAPFLVLWFSKESFSKRFRTASPECPKYGQYSGYCYIYVLFLSYCCLCM